MARPRKHTNETTTKPERKRQPSTPQAHKELGELIETSRRVNSSGQSPEPLILPSPAVITHEAAFKPQPIQVPIGSNSLQFNAFSFSLFYDAMHRKRGFGFPPHLEHVAYALTDLRIPKLLVIIGPGSGKSLMLSTVFPSFSLGLDPTMTLLGISAGEALIQGFQNAVMDWIEFDPTWAEMFPNVQPDKKRGWSSERGMFVTGHSPGDPDASYFAAGLTSKRLTGVHARTIIGDDIHDKENSDSTEACFRVREFFYSQIIGRADPRGARFIFAGRRWNSEDLYGHLKQTGEWVVMELPAQRNDRHLYWDVTVPEGLDCCFTEIHNGEPISNMGSTAPVLDASI